MTTASISHIPSATTADTIRAVRLISRQQLHAWPAAMMQNGRHVVAPISMDGQPASRHTEYRLLTTESPLPTGLSGALPRMSPKDAWFPRTEPILQITREGRNLSVRDPDVHFPAVVVFGARPCDASAPEILAPLFGWSYQDIFFEQRRKNLAFVVLACGPNIDAACFCTSVGIDPAGEHVGDVLLTPIAEDQFLAQAQSNAGEALLAMLEPQESVKAKPLPAHLTASLTRQREEIRARIPRRFSLDRVRQALETNFASPIWQKWASSCLACGVCAFTCPTCHCFDIQDEMHGSQGLRQKNWDSCMFPLFTLHTSGHNPRPDQASRWRQRLSHKFRYYPDKFNRVLCTGCGRCMRNCPAGLDLLANLMELDAIAPTDLRELKTTSTGLGAAPGIEGGNPADSSNIYRPHLMKIAALTDETPDVRTLRLEFLDPQQAAAFRFRVGQFGLYSALGEGECVFCIASSSSREGYIECTFRQAGRVTRALRRLNVGDVMGFRGPYGNSFPVESWRGHNLLFIAGGIALPPLRSVLQYCLDNRQDYGRIIVIYGAKTAADHIYKDELAQWKHRTDIDLWLGIDWKSSPHAPGISQEAAAEGWLPLHPEDPAQPPVNPEHRRYTAFVPQLLQAVRPSPKNCITVLCGPPVMIRLTLQSLHALGFPDGHIYTTLENRMKCGVGKCGRCNIGGVYICKDGPVFTAEQVAHMPPEF